MPWKVIFENSKKNSSLKKWKKKFGENQQGNQKQCEIQITIFLHSLYFSLSVCINSLFGKILEREIFQLKAGTHICVGWTRSGSIPKLPNKHEATLSVIKWITLQSANLNQNDRLFNPLNTSSWKSILDPFRVQMVQLKNRGPDF